MPEISIIILNWNTRNFLEACLDSIFANPPSRSFEVIVVDNNSEETLSGLDSKFSEIRLISNSYNYGFAVGNNIGYRASSGKYVMPLNPDTLVFPGTIDRLIAEIENDESVGVAVPVVKGKRSTPKDHSFFAVYFTSMVVRNTRRFLQRFRSTSAEHFDVEFFGGTGYVCRRSALASDKMFREDYFLFGEEYYLCREMSVNRYKVRVVPNAEIEHFTSVTFKNDPTRLSYTMRLGVAVNSEIHRQQLGRFLGTIGVGLLCAEHVPKLIFLRLLRFVRGYPDPKLERATAVSRAMVSALIPLLAHEEAFRKQVNREAELYFNNCEKPDTLAHKQ